jgi:hypothetical protein
MLRKALVSDNIHQRLYKKARIFDRSSRKRWETRRRSTNEVDCLDNDEF